MDNSMYMVKVAAYIGAALVMGIGSIGPAIGQGMIGSKAFDSVAKNPDLRGSLQFMMIIAMGFVESIAVYCLLVSIFLIFLT